MKKRILSIILATLMVIGSVGTFAIGASAAGGASATAGFTLSVDVEKVDADTVHVVLNMANNPGVSGIDVTISFDNTVIRPVSFDTNGNGDMDTILQNAIITTNVGSGVDLTTLNAVSFLAVGLPSQIGKEVFVQPSGKLIGFTFDVLDSDKFTELKIDADIANKDGEIPVVAKNSSVGLRSLEDVTLSDKTVTYNGQVQSLEVSGLDSEMSVSWKNNDKVDAGVYQVTAVVSKPGYNSKTLTATLTIEKAEAKLTGVELWSAVEGSDDIEIKSVEAAVAEVQGEVYPVVFNNAKVVKDGGVYKIEGVTVVNTNVVLTDTTVVPNFVAEDKFVETIVAEADIDTSVAVDPRVSKLPVLDVKLPYGYAFELVPNADVEADGSFEKGEDAKTVDVVYNVVDADGNETGETVTVTYTIPKKVAGSDLATLLLYYHKLMEGKNKQVEAVKSNVAGATVAAGTKVTLATATAGATIHYTTDGTTATVLSPVYTGPIVVNETVTINAIAVKSGMKTSSAASFLYTVVENSITLKADAANIKYLEGRGDKFEPTANATRYEVIKAIANLFDIKTNNAPLVLTDVSDEYNELVDLCTAAGIIKGYGDKTFRGNDGITRAEVATMICNAMKLDVEGAKDAGFKDVSGWAANYVNACANAGYVQGKGDSEFAPSENITRAELATLFNNITGAEAGTSCSYADVDADAWYFGYVAAAAK